MYFSGAEAGFSQGVDSGLLYMAKVMVKVKVYSSTGTFMQVTLNIGRIGLQIMIQTILRTTSAEYDK